MRWGNYIKSIYLNSFLWIVLWMGGQVRWTVFVALLVFPHWYSFMNAVSLSVDQLFNACTVVNSKNFRISGRAGLLLGPNQSSLFIKPLNNYYISNIVFSSRVNWVSLVSFSKLSLVRTSLWNMTEVWLLVPLKVWFLVLFFCETVSKVVAFEF